MTQRHPSCSGAVVVTVAARESTDLVRTYSSYLLLVRLSRSGGLVMTEDLSIGIELTSGLD